jgi:hypothetical protein
VVPVDHDVARLDVTVDDTGAVGGGEQVGDVDARGHHALGGERPGREQLGQRAALDQLHDQVRATGQGAHLVHPGHAGVPHAREQRRLAPQPGVTGGLAVPGHGHLHGVLVGAPPHAVHDRLTTVPDDVDDVVAGHPLARGQRPHRPSEPTRSRRHRFPFEPCVDAPAFRRVAAQPRTAEV